MQRRFTWNIFHGMYNLEKEVGLNQKSSAFYPPVIRDKPTTLPVSFMLAKIEAGKHISKAIKAAIKDFVSIKM